jgi:hypothetical protein
MYIHPSSALHPCKHTNPLYWVDWSTLLIYFLVPLYLSTLEQVQMSQDPLPCSPQTRNNGLPLAHLSFSMAALLGPPHWLLPPQCAPELVAPGRARYVATFTLAQYDVVVINWAIQLHRVRLTQYTKLAEHAQQVETVQSTTLVKWQHQEDTVHTKASTKEADM